MKITRVVLACALMGAAVAGHAEPEGADGQRSAKAQLADRAEALGVSDVAAVPMAAPKAVKIEAESAPNRSVEEIMRENGAVIVDNPLFGGVPFLALTGEEHSLGDYAKLQRERAVNVCLMMGYAEPVLVAVRWINLQGSAVTVDDKGSGTVSMVKPFQKTKQEWEPRWYGGYSGRWYGGDYMTVRVGEPFPWGAFSRIACKGKSEDAHSQAAKKPVE